MSEFARGARVGGGVREDADFDIDSSGLAEAGLLFQNSKRHPNEPDLHGRAVVDGQAFKVQAHWRSARDGRRLLRLRFFRLRTPPPREPVRG